MYTVSDHEINVIVDHLLPIIKNKKIITLSGTLGAGKTTLVQHLSKALGVEDPISSPTYTYMNSYSTPSYTIYHFDLYRLSTYEEFVNAGFDEYLTLPDSLCLIEWPEILDPWLDKNTLCSVSIDYQENKRCYTLSY